MGWYGPQTGSCSCCPPPGNDCKILIDDFNRSNNDNVGADWTEQLPGSGWEISGNVLTTDVADDLITANDGHPDGDSDLRAWVRLRGAVDDQMRVVVCYVDDDNYLFGQVEIADDCVLLTLWKRVLGVNTQLGETLVAFTSSADGWHTLLVCHQAEYYPASQWLSARLITEDNVVRYLVEEVDTAVSPYGGLGTGALNSSAPIAEFDDFNLWILQSPTWPQCPDCEYRSCVIGTDNFERDDAALGCEWDIISGAPYISSGNAMRFDAEGIAQYLLGHPDDGPPYPQYLSWYWNLQGASIKGRVYLGWKDASEHHYIEVETGTNNITGPGGGMTGHVRLYRVSGGVATQLGGTQDVPGIGTTWEGDFRACYTGDYIELQYSVMSWGASTTDSEGRFIGFGAGGAFGSAYIWNMTYERHWTADWPECKECVTTGVCENCQDDITPDNLLATVAGLTNSSCSACTGLNGNYVTPFNTCGAWDARCRPGLAYGHGFDQDITIPDCCYRRTLGSACYGAELCVAIVKRVTDSHWYYFATIMTNSFFPPSEKFYWFWRDMGSDKPDCMDLITTQQVLPYQARWPLPGWNDCDASAASITIRGV